MNIFHTVKGNIKYITFPFSFIIIIFLNKSIFIYSFFLYKNYETMLKLIKLL
jgi:hypothetical protein